jgi:uncharacterized phage infection (PIP) family protein YhgE
MKKLNFYRKTGIIIFFFFAFSCEFSDPELYELVLSIKTQNEELLAEVKILKAKSDSLINELKASTTKQAELLQKVNDLQVQLSDVLAKINQLTTQMQAQGADLTSIKSQLDDLQKKYEGILKQLEQLQQLSKILSELEVLKNQISGLSTNYTTILSNLAENKAQLEAIKTQIAAVQTKLNENFTAISQLTAQLSQQGANISQILLQIADLKKSNDELKKLLEQLIGQVAPKIGDEYAGGIVFYLDATSLHGLVVSKVNLSNGGTEWGCYCQDIKNTKAEVGAGSNNTKEMLSQCLSAQNIGNWAAKIVDNYISEGKTDWFLPSKDELNLIYLNVHKNGLGSFSTTVPYWSSTQTSYGSCGISGGAWTQNFGTGQQIQEYKAGYAGTGAVRAVRSF